MAALRDCGTIHGAPQDTEDEDEEEVVRRRDRLAKKVRARRTQAGPLTRREAAHCVLARATLMANTPSTGFMLSLRESTKDCLAAIEAVMCSEL